jgi:hypothetical protein
MTGSERKETVACVVNEINLCGYPHVKLESIEKRNLVRAVVLPVRGERGKKLRGYALKYQYHVTWDRTHTKRFLC